MTDIKITSWCVIICQTTAVINMMTVSTIANGPTVFGSVVLAQNTGQTLSSRVTNTKLQQDHTSYC